MPASETAPDNRVQRADDYSVPPEQPLQLFINGGFYASAMLSPGMEREYVVGHLYAEGIIHTPDDIVSLDMEGRIAEVEINRTMLSVPSKLIFSGCGGAASLPAGSYLPLVSSDATVPRSVISAGIRDVLNSRLYRETRGVHKCTLLDHYSFISSAEDIGRHNALDKAIGSALLNGRLLVKACAAVTGRISSEMALKCARAGIPVLASKTSVTSYAIELGNATGLTVVGFVSGEKMTVFTNSWRLV